MNEFKVLDANQDHSNNNNPCSNSKRNGESCKQKQFINIAELPTLKDICCVRIIENLWKNPIICEIVGDIHKKPIYFQNVDEIEDFENILKSMDELLSNDGTLPTSLRRYCVEFAKPMGWSLFHWLNNLSYFEFSIKELLETFSWKGNGLPEKFKSIESLIKDKETEQCIYEIACYNCASNLVPKIWCELPESSQRYYTNFASYNSDNGLNLLAYWTAFAVEAEVQAQKKLPTFGLPVRIRNTYTFPKKDVWVLLERNPIFMEYLCQNPEFMEKNSIVDLLESALLFREQDELHLIKFPLKILFSFRKTKKPWDISINACLICRLFSLLSYDQQLLILKKHGLFMLEMLLVDWPCRKYFFPLIEAMWDFLEENIYVKLIFTIQTHLQTGRCPEKDILEQLWYITPPRFKAYFIRYVSNSKLVRYLLLNSPVPFFEMLLRSIDVSERETWYRYLVSEKTKFFSFLKECKLNCFDALIKSIQTKDDYLSEIKSEVVKIFGKSLCYDWTMKEDLDKLDQFVEWCFPNDEEIEVYKLSPSEKQEVLAHLAYMNQVD